MRAHLEWTISDVTIVLDGTKMALLEEPTMTAPNKNQAWPKNGVVTRGSIELTADEAIKLANELISAAIAAKDMDLSYANTCWKTATHQHPSAQNIQKPITRNHEQIT